MLSGCTEVVYSLPFNCPVPFPLYPAYPIAPELPPDRTLAEAYLDALYDKQVSHTHPLKAKMCWAYTR